MKDLYKKKLKKLGVLAFGTGIDDEGEYAIFAYRDNTEKELPKKLGKFNIVEKKYTGNVDGLNGFLGEQCVYWGEFGDYKEDKLSYPLYKKGQKVIMIVHDDMGQAYYNPDGKYTDRKYNATSNQVSNTYGKKYDWIDYIELKEATIVNGPYDEREGWCYQLDIEKEYLELQTNLAFTIEEAKEELKRRIEKKINPLQKTLKFIDEI